MSELIPNSLPEVSETELVFWKTIQENLDSIRNNINAIDHSRIVNVLRNRYWLDRDSDVFNVLLLRGDIHLCVSLMPEILHTLSFVKWNFPAAVEILSKYSVYPLVSEVRKFSGRIVYKETFEDPDYHYESIVITLKDINPDLAKVFLEKLMIGEDSYKVEKAKELSKKYDMNLEG